MRSLSRIAFCPKGAGVSGAIESDSLDIRPGIGFDIGVGVADGADVTVSGLGATLIGSIDIDPAYGFRGYVEAEFQPRLGGQTDNESRAPEVLSVTPRLFLR